MLKIILKPFVFVLFHLWLKRLIEANYRRRAVCAILRKHGAASPFPEGDYPDQWFWADALAARYGFFVGSHPGRDKWIQRYVQRLA